MYCSDRIERECEEVQHKAALAQEEASRREQAVEAAEQRSTQLKQVRTTHISCSPCKLPTSTTTKACDCLPNTVNWLLYVKRSCMQELEKRQEVLDVKEAELTKLRAELSEQERDISQRSVAVAAVESRVADASSAEVAAQAARAAAEQREAEAMASEGRSRDLERAIAARENEVFVRERELRESSRQVCLQYCLSSNLA